VLLEVRGGRACHTKQRRDAVRSSAVTSARPCCCSHATATATAAMTQLLSTQHRPSSA
jgi:hypothetical protein